ncbi:MAG: exonuclease [Synechococcus sp. CPC35]|nr:exonuclease [Synechococcus sp. CPC35]
MKTFEILDYGFESLPTENIDGKRYYVTPTGEKYPSVTSVTGLLSRDGIKKWRKRVGEKTANKISTQAARHGTSAHQLFEDYIRGDNFEEKFKGAMPTTQQAFISLEKELNQIGVVHGLESPLYSHNLQLAGRVDCIAEWNGKLSVIDFKTSAKPKKEEWIQNYFIQETAYAKMFEELTGETIHAIITMIAVSNGSSQLFIEQPSDRYVDQLQELRSQYRTEYGL